jgi:hypothetical protein
MSSGPFTDRKCSWHSVATALATSVFPAHPQLSTACCVARPLYGVPEDRTSGCATRLAVRRPLPRRRAAWLASACSALTAFCVLEGGRRCVESTPSIPRAASCVVHGAGVRGGGRGEGRRTRPGRAVQQHAGTLLEPRREQVRMFERQLDRLEDDALHLRGRPLSAVRSISTPRVLWTTEYELRAKNDRSRTSRCALSPAIARRLRKLRETVSHSGLRGHRRSVLSSERRSLRRPGATGLRRRRRRRRCNVIAQPSSAAAAMGAARRSAAAGDRMAWHAAGLPPPSRPRPPT